MTQSSPASVLMLDGRSLPDRAVIGGKAWSIARMKTFGLPVPPAFVITTAACKAYQEDGALAPALVNEIAEGILWLEAETGRTLGQGPRPLLVSVRSGAPISMPGMMDTVLNLGINEETEALLAAECESPEFARDTHRRFLDLYASIVLKASALELDPAETPDTWRAKIAADTGERVPEGVRDQLLATVRAVFDSWNSRRAKRYRAHHGISDDLGTAVTIQAMVFGNLDARSGTGVLFSRNPLTGEPQPYGEYLPRAQGEDVVSGKHTPQPLASMGETNPHALTQLLEASALLEREGHDVQDIEFTVESGTLFLLQSRPAKRAPHAAARIALDMVEEGLIEPREALSRITAEQMRILLRPRLGHEPGADAKVLAKGEGASPGIGFGVVVSDPEEAEARAHKGEHVVLARETTSPNDVHGMIAAHAILTEQGGSTSHAAVVGRALGRPCVVGCGRGTVTALIGRIVTVDGQTGTVYDGHLDIVEPSEADDPIIGALAQLAAKHTPVEIREHAPDGVETVSFDDIDLNDPAALAAAFEKLPRGAVVEGAVFAANDDAVAKALAAGVNMIVTQPRLPALIAAINITP